MLLRKTPLPAYTYVQEPPFCVQVEFTEGCNLQCTFCGIQGIREKAGGPFKFMTPEVAERVAANLADAKWNSRIEFAMHGEPSLNPEFVDLVGIFSKRLPRSQLMMTSNGAGFLKDTSNTIDALFDAGLNVLALDDYKNIKIVPKVVERYKGSVKMAHYPEDGLELSPHRRWPRNTKVIILIKDLEEAAAGSHAVITNHCGCGGPTNETKAGQRCAKPFRELGIRWDGAVAGCCNDWRGVYKVGNSAATPLESLWQGPEMTAMRKKLYHGQRDFGPCKGCDYVSYRVGLLPDKLGKEPMGRPTPFDLEVINKATRGGTYAPIVFRPWEKK
jgi:MoaA/NifB/PqqE/SkfB family radical SAM enzyme